MLLSGWTGSKSRSLACFTSTKPSMAVSPRGFAPSGRAGARTARGNRCQLTDTNCSENLEPVAQTTSPCKKRFAFQLKNPVAVPAAAPLRGGFLWLQDYFVAKPFQSTHQAAGEPITLQTIKVVSSQLLVILLTFQHVINEHQNGMSDGKQSALFASPSG